MSTTAWIVERRMKSGPNIGIGFSKDGRPEYAEFLRYAVHFMNKLDAIAFMRQVERANLPVYSDMLNQYMVAEHSWTDA